MQFTVKKYTPEHKSEWDTFVATAKNATFLFNRDFMDYHSDRFEDFSLLVFKKDTLFALLPANRNEDTVYSHQGLTYGGLVLQKNAKLLDTFDAFKALLAYLNRENLKALEVKILPSFYTSLPSDELSYFMFRAGAVLQKRDVVMLIPYANALGFQKNRREGINKAKRNKLEIRVDDNYKIFWEEILIPNLKRRHDAAPVHNLKEIERLASRFPENIRQVNVYKNNKIVAGTTVFLTKTTVHPQYVSANTSKNSYGSLDLLYDFVMRHFQDNRSYFDFNTSSESDGKVLNKGLLFWKESCGARTFSIDTYVVDTAAYNQLHIPLL